MYISLFDMFKVGIGPSSSHTVGPMRAARRFLLEMPREDFLKIAKLNVTLYGSLAHTGRGHGTDTAMLLGLCGELPDEVDTTAISAKVAAITAAKKLKLLSRLEIDFDPAKDLVFDFKNLLPIHSNGMLFCAYDAAGNVVAEREMYSIGGGFVVDADEHFVGSARGAEVVVPYPFVTMQELLDICAANKLPMWEVLLANEAALHGEAATHRFVALVARTMHSCIDKGLNTSGILPGGLNVKRRASGIAQQLRLGDRHSSEGAMNWVSAFAIAVNEENAAGSRVVTAPTNGAAGVVPAVLRYFVDFRANSTHNYAANNTTRMPVLGRLQPPFPEPAEELSEQEKIYVGTLRYLLVAAAIGALCKRNASISGAEVGCQGEVGSAAAMAAGGLAAALGASAEQIENAAEIALEHHLGMTCDPIGGLVQVPCIERNAMGAVKAINACSLAMMGDGTHLVSLDQAIETMRRTGADMQSKYKETALGGLAITVALSVRQVEC